MSYLAYLCYRNNLFDEDDITEVVVEFVEPQLWKYAKVVPIQFSVLHSWTDKDKELYK